MLVPVHQSISWPLIECVINSAGFMTRTPWTAKSLSRCWWFHGDFRGSNGVTYHSYRLTRLPSTQLLGWGISWYLRIRRLSTAEPGPKSWSTQVVASGACTAMQTLMQSLMQTIQIFDSMISLAYTKLIPSSTSPKPFQGLLPVVISRSPRLSGSAPCCFSLGPKDQVPWPCASQQQVLWPSRSSEPTPRSSGSSGCCAQENLQGIHHVSWQWMMVEDIGWWWVVDI